MIFLWNGERLLLMTGSPRASTHPIHSAGPSGTPNYYAGPSTTPTYSAGPSRTPNYSVGPSTTPTYSAGPSRSRPINADCSNCKFLTTKIKLLEKTLEMHMHAKNHTLDSATPFHDLYSDLENFDLE